MIHRITRVAGVRLLAAAVTLLSFTACGGEASKYSGSWKRDLYGEGEVQMKLASNGGMELMLPSPRWPDSVDMKGRAAFSGDTLIFKADTAGSACRHTNPCRLPRCAARCRCGSPHSAHPTSGRRCRRCPP